MSTILFTPENFPLHSWARTKHPSPWEKLVSRLNWLLGEE